MIDQDFDNVSLIVAARSGDREALEELLRRHLPLVYNIVGRALRRRADVDDVVQDTMVSFVRGLAGLRDPQRFRSWLVAVTVNEIRRHLRSAPPVSASWDESHSHADPHADFVDYTLSRLELSAQRREAEQASAWLDDAERQLLSLWWLEVAEELSRAHLVEALQQNPHHVTIRIGRMRNHLETARRVVRALATNPRCPQLDAIAAPWHRRPEPLWRKRFARHLRQCQRCMDVTGDIVPSERLLLSALLPPPTGECIAKGGPVANTDAGVAKMAVALAQG